MDKSAATVISVVVAVIVIVGIIVTVIVVGNHKNVASVPSPTPAPSPSGSVVPSPSPSTTADGLVVTDTIVGDGAVAKSGDSVTVNYVGTLTNGTKFDSSIDRGTPFSFTLGAGDVIKGWDEGVVGMRVGGERLLTIPPALGYGASAQGSIPANSTLNFDITLLSIK